MLRRTPQHKVIEAELRPRDLAIIGSRILGRSPIMTARVFGAEDVLYNEQTSWTELFRRPTKPRSAPSISST